MHSVITGIHHTTSWVSYVCICSKHNAYEDLDLSHKTFHLVLGHLPFVLYVQVPQPFLLTLTEGPMSLLQHMPAWVIFLLQCGLLGSWELHCSGTSVPICRLICSCTSSTKCRLAFTCTPFTSCI